MLGRLCAGGRSRRVAFAPILVLPTVFVLVSGCMDSQGPTNGVPGFSGQYNPAQSALVFRLPSASGGTSALQLVASNLAYDPDTQHLHAQVTVRNSGSETLPGPDGVTVRGFVPASVAPLNAACDPSESPGGPSCTFDYRGHYGDDGLLGPGESSQPVEWILLDPGAESFAFHVRLAIAGVEAGQISGFVFEDRNANGRRDAGDPGVPATGVTLVSGDRRNATQTDPSGRFSFRVSEPGLYEVAKEPHQGFAVTTLNPLQVAIVERPDGTLSSFTRADFGWSRNGGGAQVRIEGVVYEDVNWNGVRDSGELGIPWAELSGEACDVDVDDIRTDGLGRYTVLMPVCNGPWTVRSSSLDGFTRTTPKTVTFTALPTEGEPLHADFGYVRKDPASDYEIRGTVFRDDNGNGFRDLAEPGVAGVEVRARGIACAVPSNAVTFTDERGRFELDGDDVRCGLPWIVERGALPGTHETTPGSIRLDLPPIHDDRYDLLFGLAADDPLPPQASYVLEGTVFLDFNRSGHRDLGEPGIAGAAVQLLGPCAAPRVAYTDAAGRYHFAAEVVAACAVTAVWQSLPDFDERSTPNPVWVDATLPPPSGLRTVDFGLRSLE